MNCPFCGAMSDAPHHSQEACIEALNNEVRRMRALLERTRSTAVPVPSGEDDPPDMPSEDTVDLDLS